MTGACQHLVRVGRGHHQEPLHHQTAFKTPGRTVAGPSAGTKIREIGKKLGGVSIGPACGWAATYRAVQIVPGFSL